MRPLTGDAEEEASWEASGVNERDQRAIPPGGTVYEQRRELMGRTSGLLSNGQSRITVAVA